MNKAIRMIILVVAVGVLLFSGYKLYETLSNYAQADTAYENSASQFVTAAPTGGAGDDSAESGTAQADGADAAGQQGSGTHTQDELDAMVQDMENVDWTRYAGPPPITVDFDAMQQEWPDVVGWLYCEGTKINYPVMQGEDNDEYLHHLPDGTYNFSGSLFMEWTNAADLSDLNTLVYGHSMKNGTMFGTLEKYDDQSYYEEHPVMWYLTPNGNYRLDLVAGFFTPADSDAYDIHLNRDSLEAFLQRCIDESTFDAGIAAEDVGRVLVLSTCSHAFDNARYIVVCKLTPCWTGEKTARGGQ